MSELKPCPFCGGEAEPKTDEMGEYAWCFNPDCDNQGSCLRVEQWNTRPREAELEKQLETIATNRDHWVLKHEELERELEELRGNNNDGISAHMIDACELEATKTRLASVIKAGDEMEDAMAELALMFDGRKPDLRKVLNAAKAWKKAAKQTLSEGKGEG